MKASTLLLFNTTGQPVFSKTLATQVAGDLVEIDLRDLPAGVYFLHVRNGEGRLVKRLIVH